MVATKWLQGAFGLGKRMKKKIKRKKLINYYIFKRHCWNFFK